MLSGDDRKGKFTFTGGGFMFLLHVKIGRNISLSYYTSYKMHRLAYISRSYSMI